MSASPHPEGQLTTLEFELPFDGSATARIGLDAVGKVLNLHEGGLGFQAGLRLGDKIVAVRTNGVQSQVNNKAVVDKVFASAKSPVKIQVVRENFATSASEHVNDIFFDANKSDLLTERSRRRSRDRSPTTSFNNLNELGVSQVC